MHSAVAKKKYARPRLTELTSEEIKTFLANEVSQGNEEAKELLNLLKNNSS
jgi:hypothetical protein